jgi:hypothetical protein
LLKLRHALLDLRKASHRVLPVALDQCPLAPFDLIRVLLGLYALKGAGLEQAVAPLNVASEVVSLLLEQFAPQVPNLGSVLVASLGIPRHVSSLGGRAPQRPRFLRRTL